MNNNKTISPQRHEDTKNDLRRVTGSPLPSNSPRLSVPSVISVANINDQRSMTNDQKQGTPKILISDQWFPARRDKLSAIERQRGAALRSRITDHGSRTNNKEVPKILISGQWSLVIDHSKRSAFTMVELLTVLAIMVIVAAISIPAFAALFAGNNMVQAQNQLSTAVAGARALAIQNHTDVALIFFEEPGHTAETAYAYEQAFPGQSGGYSANALYLQPMPKESIQYLPKGVYVATLIGGVNGTPLYDNSGLALPPTVTAAPYLPNNADRAIVFNAHGHLVIVNALNAIWPETTPVPAGSTNWGTITVNGSNQPTGAYVPMAVDFGPSSPGFILFEPANLPAADTATQSALGTYLATNSDITMISTYTGNVIQ